MYYCVGSPRRGNWATHTLGWRINWSPEVARNLILCYSKEGDVSLDSIIEEILPDLDPVV